jgi:hypothetical protein
MSTGMITAQQLSQLSALMRGVRVLDRDRQARHDFVVGVVGHPVDSAKDLTEAEASKVIDALQQAASDPPSVTA